MFIEIIRIIYIQSYECTFLNHLITEEKTWPVPNISPITRACVLNWVLKINGNIRSPAGVQFAVWYLDILFTTVRIDLDKLQLAATACYWIAVKIVGPSISAKSLVRYSNYSFQIKDLRG
ncbi:unnamed protein product [Leptidea sinapis]|uniref:Cyclin N-terminal domain-containing protein n=1 Tax=Leptidea sinapis TaxID=189913 RepID=A0A5E4QBM1_9NEOP|nr:unnamed protein product [Leptidea sinapis]